MKEVSVTEILRYVVFQESIVVLHTHKCFVSFCIYFILTNNNHMFNKLYIMHEVALEAMPKQQTTDGFHVMRVFKKRVQEWDCHCPYLWRLCLSLIQKPKHSRFNYNFDPLSFSKLWFWSLKKTTLFRPLSLLSVAILAP